MAINLAAVRAAQKRIAGKAIRTPLIRSRSFSQLFDREIWLKAEALQRTGSFKIRGATNILSQLPGKRVVAASAGNHAQGVALAAALAGNPCTVFMPTNAALPKIESTADYGATVRLSGTNLGEAVEAALAYVAQTGEIFIHPYDNPDIVAGQGTLGLEIMEDLPEVGTVIVPTGGGGLLSGVAVAVKEIRPETVVVGVEIEVARSYFESRKAGFPVQVDPGPSMADGINVTVPSDLVFGLLEKYVDHLLVVDEDQTSAALIMLLERSKIVVEPAGAVGLACLRENLLPADAPDPVVVVLSGGNIDLLLLGKMVRHGLEASGRFAEYRVVIPDQPGKLLRLLEMVSREGANVMKIDHHREEYGLPLGMVEVVLTVETRGPQSRENISEMLAEMQSIPKQ